jgi:hypothetical protein
MKYNMFFKRKAKINYPWHVYERIVSERYLFDWNIQVFYQNIGFPIYRQLGWVRHWSVWSSLWVIFRLIAGIPVFLLFMPFSLYISNKLYVIIAKYYVWKKDFLVI